MAELDPYGRPYPTRQNGYLLPSVTTDAIVIRQNQILMVTRKNNPGQGKLAFPGGFVDYNENPEVGCIRELREECSIEGRNLQLVAVHGDPQRDPRGHVITIAYAVEVDDDCNVVAADDAAHAQFYDLDEVLAHPENIAFDHYEILQKALALRGRQAKIQVKGI